MVGQLFFVPRPDPRRVSGKMTFLKWYMYGVHHKNLVTWENRAPKDSEVASPLVMVRDSPIFRRVV